MTVLLFTVALGVGALIAGFVGTLTGLGGGVVIIPLLVLVFGVNIRYAVGASLVSVIATSSGAASAYLREGYTNVRVAMFLEIATTLGALSGAMLAARVPANALAIVFGFVLIYSAYLSGHRSEVLSSGASTGWAAALRLDSSYPTATGHQRYYVQNVSAGFALMYVAGILSGLLGIGSGAVKVLAMDQAMRLPFKVSTTTSNFMIGVTAAASSGLYLRRGYIDPGLAMPVVLGVLAGSVLGARFFRRAQTERLRLIFMWVIVVLAVEMLYDGLTGKL